MEALQVFEVEIEYNKDTVKILVSVEAENEKEAIKAINSSSQLDMKILSYKYIGAIAAYLLKRQVETPIVNPMTEEDLHYSKSKSKSKKLLN